MQDKSNTTGEDALHRFIDGCLDEHEKLDMLDLLSEQADEAERVNHYQHQNNMLRALRRGLDVGSTDDFCPDLQAQIVQQMHRRPLWRHPAVSALAASVAVLAIASTLYVGVDFRPIAKAPLEAGSAEVVPDDTLIDSREPRSESAGPIRDWHFPFALKPAANVLVSVEPELSFQWFNKHMDGRSIRQPDLSGHGLTLVRVAALAEQPTPALHLSYRDQAGEPVELFAGILSQEMRAAFSMVADGHISMHWRLGELMFALIAPSDSPQLNKIVDTVSAAVESGAGDSQLLLDTARVDSERTLLTDPSQVILSPPSQTDLGVNDLKIGAPVLDHATMMFVPVPRPNRSNALAVEPPQALPPSMDDEKAEAL